MTVSIVAGLVRAIQMRSRRAVLSLVLGALAASLFYINATTPWLRPYRTH